MTNHHTAIIWNCEACNKQVTIEPWDDDVEMVPPEGWRCRECIENGGLGNDEER